MSLPLVESLLELGVDLCWVWLELVFLLLRFPLNLNKAKEECGSVKTPPGGDAGKHVQWPSDGGDASTPLENGMHGGVNNGGILPRDNSTNQTVEAPAELSLHIGQRVLISVEAALPCCVSWGGGAYLLQ